MVPPWRTDKELMAEAEALSVTQRSCRSSPEVQRRSGRCCLTVTPQEGCLPGGRQREGPGLCNDPQAVLPPSVLLLFLSAC